MAFNANVGIINNRESGRHIANPTNIKREPHMHNAISSFTLSSNSKANVLSKIALLGTNMPNIHLNESPKNDGDLIATGTLFVDHNPKLEALYDLSIHLKSSRKQGYRAEFKLTPAKSQLGTDLKPITFFPKTLKTAEDGLMHHIKNASESAFTNKDNTKELASLLPALKAELLPYYQEISQRNGKLILIDNKGRTEQRIFEDGHFLAEIYGTQKPLKPADFITLCKIIHS